MKRPKRRVIKWALSTAHQHLTEALLPSSLTYPLDNVRAAREALQSVKAKPVHVKDLISQLDTALACLEEYKRSKADDSVERAYEVLTETLTTIQAHTEK